MNISVECSHVQYFELDLDIDFRHLYMYGSWILSLFIIVYFVYGILQNVKGIKTIYVELIKICYDYIKYM